MFLVKNAMLALFAGAMMLFAAGCVDNGVPNELPPAWNNPKDGLNFAGEGTLGNNGLTDPTQWGAGAGEDIGGAADRWQKIEGRLGFPNIYYAYDSDALAAQEQTKLDVVATYMNEHPEILLIIEGNCDERGTEEYNRALGERRAIAVKNFLMAKGVADGRLRTISFGKDNPAVQGTGEAVYAQNRRSELWPALEK